MKLIPPCVTPKNWRPCWKASAVSWTWLSLMNIPEHRSRLLHKKP